MSELSKWIKVVEVLLALTKKEMKGKGEVPPIDPKEIAKCVRDLQLKLIEEKAAYIKFKSDKGTVDENLLYQNIRRMMSKMRLKVERKKVILRIPVSKEEYVYEFIW